MLPDAPREGESRARTADAPRGGYCSACRVGGQHCQALCVCLPWLGLRANTPPTNTPFHAKVKNSITNHSNHLLAAAFEIISRVKCLVLLCRRRCNCCRYRRCYCCRCSRSYIAVVDHYCHALTFGGSKIGT